MLNVGDMQALPFLLLLLFPIKSLSFFSHDSRLEDVPTVATSLRSAHDNVGLSVFALD